MNDTRPYSFVANEVTGEVMPLKTNIFLTSLRRNVWRHDLADSVVEYLE